MKILIVTPYFFPQIGGLESYVHFVSKSLSASKKNHVVIVTSNPQSQEDSIDHVDGLKVHRLRTMFKLSNTPINPNWIFTLQKIIKDEKPDLINAHSPVPFIADVASFLAWKNNIPFVLTYHAGSFKKNQFLPDLITGVYSATIEKLMTHGSKKIITLNDFVRETTLKDLKEKTVVLLPGITLSSKNRQLKKSTPTPKDILFVGKLDKTHAWKGLTHLLDAAKILKDRDISFHLNVVGGGDNLAFYKSKAKTLLIDSNVTFHGTVPNIAVSKYYANSDIFVLPSYSNAESLGLVILEAMSFGLPVVATRVGGIPFTVKNGVNGMLVEPESPTSLADGISQLLSDNKLFEMASENNFEKAKSYNWESHTSSLEKVFKSVVSNEKAY